MASKNQSPGSLKGTTPLAYAGTTPNMVLNTRRPTTTDVKNFVLGTWWVIPKKLPNASPSAPTSEVWILTGNAQNTANWQQLTDDIASSETLTGNSGGPVSATANNINIIGSGSVDVAGNPGTSTLTISVNDAAETLTGNSGGAVGPTTGNINIIGSGSVTVAGNPGTSTLTISSSLTAETLTGNSGGAVGPTGGNITIVGTGSVTVAGNPGTSTLTISDTGVTLTNHSVALGTGSAGLSSVGPGAFVGVPLISQGAAADPVFSTALVRGGGTGLTSATAYAPIVGGTTTTGNFQSAATGIATAGYVLTSNGNAAVPSWQAVSAPPGSGTTLNVIVYSTPGSDIYTPSAGMFQAMVEVQGGGAGADGNPNLITNSYFSGSSGGYCKKLLSAATIGASQTVTVGSGGAGGVRGALGRSGGTSTFGSLLTGGGGVGSFSSPNNPTAGIASGGDINISGQPGIFWNDISDSGIIYLTTCGANSFLGIGGTYGSSTASHVDGQAGTGYGSGGGSGNGVSGNNGGDGAPGVVIITEYIG